jgi:hypothetical protein
MVQPTAINRGIFYRASIPQFRQQAEKPALRFSTFNVSASPQLTGSPRRRDLCARLLDRFRIVKEEPVALIQLHRSFGVAVCVVTLGRLVWRQFARFPNWAADMPQAMRFAAQWSEYALYAFLPTQPILGLLHTNARGDRVNLFFPASWRRCAAGSAR